MIGSSVTVADGLLIALTAPDVPVKVTFPAASVLRNTGLVPCGTPVNCAQNVTVQVPPDVIERFVMDADVAPLTMPVRTGAPPLLQFVVVGRCAASSTTTSGKPACCGSGSVNDPPVNTPLGVLANVSVYWNGTFGGADD